MLVLCFVFSVYILLTVSTQVVAEGSFTTSPTSFVQAEGLNATFYCLHLSASATGWRLNGTSVNVRHPPNVFVGTTDGGGTHYLTILATSEYNETVVQCFAFVDNNGTQSVEETVPVSMTVQGPIGSVSNVSQIPLADAIAIRWVPPFSLNLTNAAEPDIIYCIEVFNATDDNQTNDYLITSDCGVVEPRYTFTVSEPDPTDLFEIIIIPRSNVVGATNGTPSERLEVYFYVRPSICADSVGLEISNNDLKIITHIPQWRAKVVIMITLWNIGDKAHQTHCDCVIITSPTTSNNCTDCSNIILGNRAYKVRVKCQNDIGTAELDRDVPLSTHGIVNSSFSFESPGKLHFTCHFSPDSTDRGCLIVTQGVVTEENAQHRLLYKVAYKHSNGELTASATLQGLPPGKNVVYLYEIEKTGLPGRYPALNKSVVILGDSQTTASSLPNETFNNVTLLSTAQQICITYSLKTNYLGCTIIHVPCIADGIWDPISVYYLNTQTQTTCFSVASVCNHSIALFGVGKNGTVDSAPAKTFLINEGAESSDRSFPNTKEKCQYDYLLIILGSLLAVCTLVITFILTVCLIKLNCSRKTRSNSQLSVARSEAIQSDYADVAMDLHKCEAYETVTTARSRQIRSEQSRI